mgnify:CR=1 FL=1
MKTIYDIGLALMALAWVAICFILVPDMFKGDDND